MRKYTLIKKGATFQDLKHEEEVLRDKSQGVYQSPGTTEITGDIYRVLGYLIDRKVPDYIRQKALKYTMEEIQKRHQMSLF